MTRAPGSWQQRWFERLYSSRPGWVDGTTLFQQLIAENTPKANAKILEVGAGPTNANSDFLATLGELHGIDIDDEVRGNTALRSAEVVEPDAAYPYPDDTFDVCVSSYVVEHVSDPAVHLSQIARVLAPGGLYIFRTPNLCHPIALVTAATPHWFHTLVANRLRRLPADAHPPWPTEFKLNTRRAIRRHARDSRMEVVLLRMLEGEPSYGMSSRILFLAFAAYERVVNSTELLSGARINVQAVLRKASGSQ